MKRINLSIILGMILGVFCIIGVGTRISFNGNEVFFFGMWYNRVIMGLIIGLAGRLKFNLYLRGSFLGLIISLAFFLSANFRDVPGFFAGIFYGVIIDVFASKYSKLLNSLFKYFSISSFVAPFVSLFFINIAFVILKLPLFLF